MNRTSATRSAAAVLAGAASLVLAPAALAAGEPAGGAPRMFRLHDGRSLRAMPIYMPADSAIPAPEVPAAASFGRTFVPDKRVLQREAVGSSALQLPAYLLLAAIAAVWLGTMAWGLARLGAGGVESQAGPSTQRSRGRLRVRRGAALARTTPRPS
jgi:hypothetical protein